MAERAFQLWEEQGRPEGRDYENWLRAEREVLGESSEPLADAELKAGGGAADDRKRAMADAGESHKT